MEGAAVRNLHDALRLLLDHGLLRINDDQRREFEALLAPEREHQMFRDATAKLVGIFQESSHLPVTGEVDQPTADRLNEAVAPLGDVPQELQYLVRGQVLYRGGLPIPTLTVRAFHRAMRQDVELGSIATDASGNFEIYYNPSAHIAQAGESADRPPDLFVRVFENARDGKLLVESPTRFAAPSAVKFRLLVDGGPANTWSEYEQLEKELHPFLAQVPIAEIVEDHQHQDVTVLAGKLAQEPSRVAAFVAAHRLAAEVNGQPEVFYGLIRKGLPTNMSELLAVPAGTRSRALGTAIREGLVPGRLTGQLRDVRKQFDTHAVAYAAAPTETAGRARLGAVLMTSVQDETKVNTLIAKLLANTGKTQELWHSLEQDPELATVIPGAQRTLQLTALTDRHLPLMKTLQQQFDTGQLKTTADLAKLSEDDWLRLISADDIAETHRVPPSIPGKDAPEKAKVYAATMARIVADTMPTQVLAHKAQADAVQPADVKAFWKNVTDGIAGFELGRGRVRPYLDRNPGLLRGVADKEALIGQIEQTQRLFNLTRSYNQQQVLRMGGLDSALSVARLGQGAFLQRLQGTVISPQDGVLIFEKAVRVAAATLDLVTQYSPNVNRVLPRVLTAPAVKQVPDLETLFGTFSLCDCDQCRSVHSPAAYFADLLAFLGDRASTTPGVTARDVLFRRRPDLGEIELTCANTNTVLPYTDLVNELLETRIAPFVPFALAAAAEGELNAKTISNDVRAAFAAKGITIDETARAIVGKPSVRWSITDGSMVYSIAKTAGAIRVTGAWPQTGASAMNLASVPEHVNAAAYDILRAEVFPWNLPLDLPTEQTRLFLGHLGSPRYELMSELISAGPSAALDDIAVAAEYLGLSDAERQYITNMPNPGRQPWEYWGLQQNGNTVSVWDTVTEKLVDQPLGWVEALGWVHVALRQSGLEYDELVRVLECAFVNPGFAVRIESADDKDKVTCDLSKLVLTNMTAAVADRLTRFVRLWRKLGSEPDELDRILVALCGSALDNTAILKLSHVTRLRRAFARGVDEIVALWVAIPTTGANPLYRRLFLNPNVMTAIDPAFALGPGGELAIVATDPANATIAKHPAAILAALRISAADLVVLQAKGFAADGKLTLANLSALYSRALLAQCLELTVPDLLSLCSMAGIDPFATAATSDTLRFVNLVEKVRQSGLDVGDLGYLLFHLTPETAAIAPPLGAPAELIADVRRQLAVIHEATTLRPDPAGDVLRREIAALRWPARMIDDAVAALGGTARYTVTLDPPPAAFGIPSDWAARLVHDPAAKTLTLTGSLAATERDTLKGLFAEANYKTAIDDLFARPRTFASSRMRAYSWPVVFASLAALPPTLSFPPALRARINYDPAAQILSFDGTMDASDKAALDALSADAPYQAATAALLAAANAFVPGPANAFVSAALADTLFDMALPADRFEAVLALALARRRASDGTRLVVRLVADTIGMKYRLAERLLTRDLPHPAAAGKHGIDAFLEDPFAASNVDVPPTEAAFPATFETTVRMMKIAALAGRMKLSDRIVDWLGDFGTTVGPRKVPWGGGVLQATWLLLKQLPAKTEAVDPTRFAAWLRLLDLARIGSGLPGGDATAGAVFLTQRDPAATADSVMARLAALSGWDKPELTALAGALGLALPQDLGDEYGLGRLRNAARRLRRLSTTTAQAEAWAAAAPSADTGVAARRAVQAAYPADQWADAIRPLEDQLREKRRAALVAYLVARPDPGKGEGWTDTNGMYSHLLLDVETRPVVLTSRLKQAIGSTQLFMQRCPMNLEPDVVADETKDIGWRQWAWMKQYRIWEANRKIFLFPENWTEEPFRDDKSPFFVELENTLLQSDVTSESAEAAYAAYLARLDEVARLEVAGVFHQPGEGGAPDEYHVFARTNADPPVHFYRKWVGQARWTPWQRLDLDIPAGQMLPLVWNHRLYLFWPIFTRKANQPAAGGDKPVEGTPYFEIQLAWSEFQQGRWGPKHTTPPDVALYSKIVPDPFLAQEGRGNHVFRATTSGDELQIWYESAESIAAQVDKYGAIVKPGGGVATDGWTFSGCNGRITKFTPYNVGVFAPPNTHPWGMTFEEGTRIKGLVPFLPMMPLDISDGTLQLPKGLTGTDSAVVLKRTPGNAFRLLSPHQEQYLTGRLPFFFHDDAETLFVVPREESEWIWVWHQPAHIDLKLIDLIHKIYYEPDPIPRPVGPIDQYWDPVPVMKQHYAMAAVQPEVLSVAAGLASPVIPTLPMGKMALAVQARRTQVLSSRVTKQSEVVALGDRKIVTISDYLKPERILAPGIIGGHTIVTKRYEFRAHYHPYVCSMVRALNLGGVAGLLQRVTQLQHAEPFDPRYGPTTMVQMGDTVKKDRYPVEDVDFSFDGAYAGYNWELFFHIPLTIACKLSQNQRFEEAQKWFHAIFDPTDVSSAAVPARYWRTRPFYERQDYLTQRIDKLLEALAKGLPDPDLTRQLSEWIANPFRPFAVARVRTVAFQKTVVMKYLDNLIAWGDQLFRRDTIESINEATQLYILAAEILGPRPPVITPRATPETHTFNTLSPQFAALTNALTDIEVVVTSPRIDAVLSSPDAPPLPVPQLLYFCVPPNDKLLGYWDTVADRLFKIRNSLNLAGIRRTLPLFEPPIDPMLLVKAAAAGVDLSTAIADLAAPVPLYRFRTLVAKAVDLCQDVTALGAALLQALERRDAEQLARIQATHEVAVLQRVTAVKEARIKEAKAEITAFEAARELAAERYRHYMTLLGAAPTVPAEGTAPADAQAVAGANTLEKEGARMIDKESSELAAMDKTANAESAASTWDAISGFSYYVPEFHVAAEPWGIGVEMDFGGRHIGPALTAVANLWRSSAAEQRGKAQKAGRLAEFIMRAHNWQLEANLASREIIKIDRDLAGARIRETLSITDQANNLKEIEESQGRQEFLSSKYTNRELYDWMIGQISAVYFQSYQLAYDTCMGAQRAFRRELAIETDFIHFGYWDSLRKGLLAGERLLHDVRRMETAYLAQNAREYEITKHVSLASLHPEGLLALQEQGVCFVDVPEAIFDLDHPGQYLRRIKSVSMTVPCVVGPYASVPCKLTLLANRTRVDPRPSPQYAITGPEDKRFEFDSGGIRSVVTSSGHEDAGTFELNLEDERYLPFEGAGGISSWLLELPRGLHSFDYRTITDVVLHFRYTARDGGDVLRDAATKKLEDALEAMEVERGRTGLTRGFLARYEFPDAWHRFLQVPQPPAGPRLSLPIVAERFPAFAAGPKQALKVTRVLVALIPAAGVDYDENDPATLTLTPPNGPPQALTLTPVGNRAGGLAIQIVTLPAPVPVVATKSDAPPPPPWTLEMTHIPDAFAQTLQVNGNDVVRIDPTKVADLAILYSYTI
jgi:hypothetical protein